MKKYLIKTEEGCKFTVEWDSDMQCYCVYSIFPGIFIFVDSIKIAKRSEIFGEINLFKLDKYFGSITFRKENLEILEDEEK